MCLCWLGTTRQLQLLSVMLTAVIAFSAFCLAQGAQSKNLHEQYEKLLKSEQKVSVPTPNRTATLSGGNEYYVTTVFTTPNCASSSAYTATGYTLGACISAGGESSYMYTDCSESGSTTFITMTSCTSTDCSSGCSSFKIPQEGSCKTMSTMKCMSGDSPWSEYDFNYHME